MSEIITAVYESATGVTNAVDDLVATGIPQEKIRVHQEKQQVQVWIAGSTGPEVTEILQRHRPIDLRTEERAEP